jgi:hypothetical protein
MVEESLEQKLKRHEDALAACMVEIQRLRAENASLKANASAHQTLKNIYGDDSQPAGVRVRAAQAALSHESAPLKPVDAPLDLVAEEYEPLAQLVERRRARQDRLCPQDLPPIDVVPIADGRRSNGNGSDGSDHS